MNDKRSINITLFLITDKVKSVNNTSDKYNFSSQVFGII